MKLLFWCWDNYNLFLLWGFKMAEVNLSVLPSVWMGTNAWCLVLHLNTWYFIWNCNCIRVLFGSKQWKLLTLWKLQWRRREEKGKSLIGSQIKSITKLFILICYTLYHLQICKLVLWIPRASLKNAIEIHAVSHFFQHLVFNMLIRGETIRTKLIYPSILAVPSFPQMLKEIDKVSVSKSYF